MDVYEPKKIRDSLREALKDMDVKIKGEKRVPILLIKGDSQEDEVKRHTLIGVEEWCVRNGIFVIHTLSL